MKKFMTFALTAALAASMYTTAFAYWQNDGTGYRYMTGKDTWLTNTYTDDGYWVDVNGYWDGKESIGIKDTATGEFVVPSVETDPFYGMQILGKRILKSQGKAQAVLSEDKKAWTVKVDVYDTAFMTANEIKAIRKGDTFELPGLGITVTAQNKASKGVIHTSSSGNSDKAKEANKNEDSGYKVRLQDDAGNQYILTASRLRKTSADSSTTETILRPVATGITVVIPTWRDAMRVNGTSHYTTTKNLVEKGMMFEATFKGDEAQQIMDVTYNYDTTNAPAYDEHAAHGHLYNINEY